MAAICIATGINRASAPTLFMKLESTAARVINAKILSVGPAVRLADHAGASVTQALELVYSPLIWAHGHTPLRRPLEFYLRLWEK